MPIEEESDVPSLIHISDISPIKSNFLFNLSSPWSLHEHTNRRGVALWSKYLVWCKQKYGSSHAEFHPSFAGDLYEFPGFLARSGLPR